VGGLSVDPPHAPLLWGDWRATSNPRLFIAECAACGGELWLHRNGFENWIASCENGCAREAIDTAAGVLLEAQRQRWRDEREARGPMEPDDPFNGIDAEVYIRRLTGREAVRGFVQCPFHGDGEERTPSLHVTGIFWHCQACKLGGTIYDFGGALWGIQPRRDGFRELQFRLAESLRKVA
jgi:hypothetical protein